MIGLHEGHPAHKKPSSTNPRGSFPEQVKEEDPRGTSLPRFTWKNGRYIEIVVVVAVVVVMV